MKIIDDVQDAFRKEAEKTIAATGNSGLPAANKSPATVEIPPATNNKEKAQKGTDQNSGSEVVAPVKADPPKKDPPKEEVESISKFLKEKHGIEMSDEDIIARLKKEDTTKTPKETPKADSVTALVAPRIEDVTEDEIGTLLEQHGRPKDILKKAADLKDKDDVSIVKQFYVDYFSETHKLNQEQAEALFNERFFIPVEGAEEAYTKEELDIGKALLKQEAERLRAQVTNSIEGVRGLIYKGKEAEYNKKLYEGQVDQFLAGANRQLVIPIGKSGAKDLGNYEFVVSEDALKQIAQTMKSPAKLVERFKNDKGDLDLQKFYDFLVYDEVKTNLFKSMANHFHSKGLDEIEATLNNEPDLSNNGIKRENVKKTEADKKKEVDTFNKDQIEKNMSRNRR